MPKKSAMKPIRVPARECSNEGVVSVRFKCGCRLQLKDGEVTLILPKDPVTGNRKRILGHVTADRVLRVYRDGRDFLRVRNGYGLNVHLLLCAEAFAFDRVHCQTPNRDGYLPSVEDLLHRKQFQYRKAGFEMQVSFRLAEIRSAA